jgi:hypothetical protein
MRRQIAYRLAEDGRTMLPSGRHVVDAHGTIRAPQPALSKHERAKIKRIASSSERIWGLVCGFPGEQRRKRQLLMLKAYVDESGRDEEYFVLAGYIATAEIWADAFAPHWQNLIELGPPHHSKIDAFHMVDMVWDLERCSWFYRVIEECVLAEISCTISVTGLHKAVRDFPWPWDLDNIQALTNPYYFGFKAIVHMLAQNQHLLGITEPVDFIFDNTHEKGECMEMWDRMQFFSRPEVRSLTGDPPIFRDDKTTLPLQAADLYAYWVREWALSGVPDAEKRFPWKRNRAIPRLDFRFEEKDFLKEWQKFVDDPEMAKRLFQSDEELGI